MRVLANNLSDLRSTSSFVIGPMLLMQGPNWPLAITTACVAATDRIDGDLARYAANILGESTTVEGSKKDHIADRKLTFGLLGFTAVKDFIDGHKASALTVASIISVSAWREIQMAKIRVNAEAEGKRTDAIMVNKLKATGLMASLAFGISPLVENKRGRNIRNVGFAASTILGIYGMKKFQQKLS
jgi:phosphatidylglycerophosphate synthase